MLRIGAEAVTAAPLDCPFCGKPQAEHVFASRTTCVIDSTFGQPKPKWDYEGRVIEHITRLDQERNEALALLEDARQSLIEHAKKLPLSERDHGPMLEKIDDFTGRNERRA